MNAEAQLAFVTDVIASFADVDSNEKAVWENIFVMVRDGRVTFMVNANDLFFWACADGEDITPENLPMLKQAIADIRAALGVPTEPHHTAKEWDTWYEAPGYAGSLFAARVRGMRPQRPCYKRWPAELHPLFDACGPVRDRKDEG